jgi:hypothetical protein
MPVIAYGLREGRSYNIPISTKHPYDLAKLYGVSIRRLAILEL